MLPFGKDWVYIGFRRIDPKSGVEILNLGSTGGMVLPRLVEEGNLLWRESR